MGPVAELPHLLEQGLKLKPDDVALAAPQGQWTWRDLEATTHRYAQNLLGLGLRPGNRVASLMPNSDALIIHYLGCFKAGLVATPLNYRYTPTEIDHALDVSGASLLLHDVSRAADIAASRFARQLPMGLASYGEPSQQGLTFMGLLQEPSAEQSFPAFDWNAPAAIFFTSGSTGPAKGVTHNARSLGSMLSNYARACAVTPGDVVAAFASLSHIGAILDHLMGLWAGAKIVIPESLEPDGILNMLRQYQPTIGVAMPITMFGLVRHPGITSNDLARFRILGAGGDKVPAELQRDVDALSGPAINEQYGMTEFGIAALNPINGETKAGSVGQVIDGYEFTIRDSAGNDVPQGSSGRLWVRSAANMIGYWNNPEATRAVLKDGWLDTGDIFTRDHDGYYWFGGRLKQLIIHDGSNITPQEVEDALLQHPAVRMVGVVGVRDVVHGENVRAFVVLRDGVSASPEELIAFARARVGYKAPKDIVALPEMPVNASGKVDRVALRRLSDARA